MTYFLDKANPLAPAGPPMLSSTAMPLPAPLNRIPAPEASTPSPALSPPCLQSSAQTLQGGPAHPVDVSLYAAAKEQLASIMRDFSAVRIHFVGHDERIVGVEEYQSIRRRIRTEHGDPAQHLKGEHRSYCVGYNKKTQSYTQNQLFFPEYHSY